MVLTRGEAETITATATAPSTAGAEDCSEHASDAEAATTAPAESVAAGIDGVAVHHESGDLSGDSPETSTAHHGQVQHKEPPVILGEEAMEDSNSGGRKNTPAESQPDGQTTSDEPVDHYGRLIFAKADLDEDMRKRKRRRGVGTPRIISGSEGRYQRSQLFPVPNVLRPPTTAARCARPLSKRFTTA